MSNTATSSFLAQDLNDFSEKIYAARTNLSTLMSLYAERCVSLESEISAERARLGVLGRFFREFSFKADKLIHLNTELYWHQFDWRQLRNHRASLDEQITVLQTNPTYITLPNDFVTSVNKYSTTECLKIEK